MKKLSPLLLIGIMISTMAGCSSLPFGDQFVATSEASDSEIANKQGEDGVVDIQSSDLSGVQQVAFDNDKQSDAFGSVNRPRILSSASGAYKGRPLTKHVGDYVQNMAQDLVSNMEYVTERTPVAVTHFALIDSDLKETNLLGQQMAESFVHEFHKFRMPVVEFKATQFIRVTETGDFALSRDFLDLSNSTPIEYVLTGTMTKHQGGYIVNARVLGMQSNVVVASAQSFIPFYVVDALLPSGSSKQADIIDGVQIIRGE